MATPCEYASRISEGPESFTELYMTSIDALAQLGSVVIVFLCVSVDDESLSSSDFVVDLLDVYVDDESLSLSHSVNVFLYVSVDDSSSFPPGGSLIHKLPFSGAEINSNWNSGNALRKSTTVALNISTLPPPPCKHHTLVFLVGECVGVPVGRCVGLVVGASVGLLVGLPVMQPVTEMFSCIDE